MRNNLNTIIRFINLSLFLIFFGNYLVIDIYTNLRNFYKTQRTTLLYLYTYITVYQITTNLININDFYQIAMIFTTKNNLTALVFMVWLFLDNKKTPRIRFLILTTYLFLYYSSLLTEFNFLELKRLNYEAPKNTLLLNGLLTIHPFLLYSGYSLIFVAFFFFVFCDKWSIKKCKSAQAWNYYTSIIFNLTLLLGAWWAEQELLWGGWWSWDMVELLGLMVPLVSLWLLHSENSSENKRWLLYLLCYFVLLTIVLVRYGMIRSIHSFGGRETRGQYIYYVAIVLLFFVPWLWSKKITKKPVFLHTNTCFYFLLILFYVFFLLCNFTFLNIGHKSFLKFAFHSSLIFFVLDKLNICQPDIKKAIFFSSLFFFVKLTLLIYMTLICCVLTYANVFKKKQFDAKFRHMHVILLLLFCSSICQAYTACGSSVDEYMFNLQSISFNSDFLIKTSMEYSNTIDANFRNTNFLQERLHPYQTKEPLNEYNHNFKKIRNRRIVIKSLRCLLEPNKTEQERIVHSSTISVWYCLGIIFVISFFFFFIPLRGRLAF